ELRTEPFDLGELVREETRLVSAESTIHDVVVELPDELPVVADKDRLAQVVGNLVTNAIKYSPAGGRVTVEGSADGELVQVRVRDQGIGIPEEHQARVFTKFFRGAARESGIPGV